MKNLVVPFIVILGGLLAFLYVSNNGAVSSTSRLSADRVEDIARLDTSKRLYILLDRRECGKSYRYVANYLYHKGVDSVLVLVDRVVPHGLFKRLEAAGRLDVRAFPDESYQELMEGNGSIIIAASGREGNRQYRALISNNVYALKQELARFLNTSS